MMKYCCKECGKPKSDVEVLAGQLYYDGHPEFVASNKWEGDEFAHLWTKEERQILTNAQASMKKAIDMLETKLGND